MPVIPENAIERLTFLEEAGKILASSLDFKTTLKNVAELAVPTVADWCAIDLCSGEFCDDAAKIERLAVTHVDPAKIELAYELEKKYPSDPNLPTGVPHVIRTGKSEFMSEIPAEMLKGAGINEEHQRLIDGLGLVGYMVLPLKVQDRVLGALTLVTAESGRIYTESDLLLGEDLAARAAIAIEHANLFRRTLEAEDHLREQLDYNDAIMRSIGEGIYSVDHDGNILYMNPTAEALLGYSMEELRGKNAHDAIHFRNREGKKVSREDCPLLSVLKSGETYSTNDDIFITKTGEELPVEFTSTPIRSGSEITGTVLAFHGIRERKEFEAVLRSQREWFEVTLRSIGDAVITTDTNGAISFINPACEAITGWKQEEAIGRPLTEVFNIVDEVSRKLQDNPFDKVIATGRVASLTNHTLLLSRDGSETPIDDSAAPILDSAGKLVGVVIVFQDISDRKRLQNLQERTQQRMSKMLENISDAFVAFDAEWRFTYLNAKGEQLFKLLVPESKNPLGKVIWAECPDLVWNDVYVQFHQAMRQQQPVEFELFIESVPGWFTVKIYPSLDGLSVFFQDVTNKKAIEEESSKLRENHQLREQKYHELIDELPQMIWTANPDGSLSYVNKWVFKYSGLSQKEAVGWGWLACVHPDDVEPTMTAWKSSLATGRGYEVHFRLRRSDGEYRMHLGTASALADKAGNIIQWFGSCTDIQDETDAPKNPKSPQARKKKT